MKALLSTTISAILFLVAPIIGIVAAVPVEASGCYNYNSGSGCTTPPPTATPSRDKNTLTLLEVVTVAVVIACPVIAVYTRIVEGRWTWCGGEADKKEPPPAFGPALKVTPDNMKDKPRKFIVEAE